MLKRIKNKINIDNKINPKYRRLFWILSFLVTGVILFFILPGKPQFKYKYQQGLPWKHSNLIAPFTYDILKSNEELKKDREEALSNVAPIFVYDTTVFQNNMAKLYKNLNLDSSATAIRSSVYKQLFNLYDDVYNNGILISSPNKYAALEDKDSLNISINDQLFKVAKSTVFSEKTAYRKLSEDVKKQFANNYAIADILRTIELNNYISSNITYDKKLTKKLRDDVIVEVSPYKGKVQSGERVILQGEVVNAEKFQLLESLRLQFENREDKGYNKYSLTLGKIILISLALLLLFLYLYIYQYKILIKGNQLHFILIYTILIIFVALFINSFPNLHIYLVPLALYSIVIRTFFDSRTSIFFLFIVTIIIAFHAPNSFDYFVIQASGGTIAVFSLNKMQKRSHLWYAAFWVFLTNSFVYTGLELIYKNSFSGIEPNTYKWFAISAIMISLVYLFIYLFEKIFGFVSDVTLIELSDSNQPLLRRLAENAPGTFQHSMQVANLSEAIIYKIGGNPFLTRAAALYHDIGKLKNPAFFIENQSAGMNPHDQISDIESAKIIISHVTDGVAMGEKYKLPKSIIHIIASHHGTTKARYFYIQHCNNHPSRAELDEPIFTYPGPLPKTREAGVVMIVDGIEAASRSLKEKTKENLTNIVNTLIDHKITENQLDDCHLTFKDIRIIREILIEKLMNIYHVRIEYPKAKS